MLKDPALETKSAAPDDLSTAFDGFMRAFEAFKDGNDERLGQLERRMAVDVVTSDKVDRLDRALDAHKRVVDDLALKSQRPHLGGPAARSGVALQHKAAFEGYVRKGEAGPLRDLEAKALSVGSDPDGGYLVPDELERSITRAVKNVSPIRAIAGVRQSGLLKAQSPEGLIGLRHEASKVASVVGKILSAFMAATEKARGQEYYEVDTKLFGNFANDLGSQRKEIGPLLDALRDKKLQIIKITPRTELGEIEGRFRL